jgi:hypothetical protein
MFFIICWCDVLLRVDCWCHGEGFDYITLNFKNIKNLDLFLTPLLFTNFIHSPFQQTIRQNAAAAFAPRSTFATSLDMSTTVANGATEAAVSTVRVHFIYEQQTASLFMTCHMLKAMCSL